jgi:hypothetical protein
LNRTGNIGKYRVGIGSDQLNGSDHNYQNDGQHYGIFGNVLALFLVPKLVKKMLHERLLIFVPEIVRFAFSNTMKRLSVKDGILLDVRQS